jgi:tetratricopeptide (TPR) repeat protein
MTASLETSNRHVIPPWRSVGQTIEAGEFQYLTQPKSIPAGLASYLDEAEREWREDPNEITAAELVGASLVAGDLSHSSEAASFLLDKSDESLLRGLAERALHPAPTAGIGRASDRQSDESFEQHLHRLLRQDRQRATADPRNPLAWASMARRYTILGQLPQADRSLSIALALAPSSRYMHRVATRLYVHMSEPDRAYTLLRRFDRTQRDPWLMAAFLAVANLANLPTTGLRQARNILNGETFAQIELSELASELGTMEMGSGQDRRARQLFEVSLEHPTGNSLAQAEWASRTLGQLKVGLSERQVPFSAEAFALSATVEGEWDDALAHSEQWLDDQPFDVRAAVHGSYISSVALEQWSASIAISRAGLRASPRHPLLSNNLAFALIEDDQLDEAARVLASVDWPKASQSDRTALTATQGLLSFRSGRPDRGRVLYEQAISQARSARDPRLEAMAESMFLRESIRSHLSGKWVTPVALSLRKLRPSISDKAVLLCVSRTERLLGPLGQS